MAKRVEAIVNPELLRWARTSAGLDVETAARKAQVKAERLESWESGESRPTVKQLRKLAKTYKRPLAVFYLPDAPKDFQAMHDFRRLPGEVAGVQSPALRYEIRRATNRREIAIELHQGTDEPLPEFTLTTTLADDSDEVAASIRDALDITIDQQIKWRPGYDSFNHWRSCFEDFGILVLQMIDVHPKETRGFSISAARYPVVVLNSKDAPAAKIFTMLHELAHLMLREGGLCDLDDHTSRAPEELEAEIFCNQVAGATLIPRDSLMAQHEVKSKAQGSSWDDGELKRLADRYGASREALLRRLLKLGYVSEAFYQRKRRQFQREFALPKAEARSGFPPPHRRAISSAGPLFVRLVLENYYNEKVTASDVAEFLELRLKHLPKVEHEVFDLTRRMSA